MSCKYFFFFWILDDFFSLLELLLMNIKLTVSPWCYPFVSTPLFSWFSYLHACLLRGESESWSLTSSRQDGFQIRRQPVPLCLLQQRVFPNMLLSSVLPHIPTWKTQLNSLHSCINNKKDTCNLLIPVPLVADNRSQLNYVLNSMSSIMLWLSGISLERGAWSWNYEAQSSHLQHLLTMISAYSCIRAAQLHQERKK